MKNKAVFLDRDGVINIEKDYVHKIEEFEFIEGVFSACLKYQQAGYKLIVITNQSGIGRGYYDESQFNQLTDWMKAQFASHGVHIDGVYFCPHHPEKALPAYRLKCECRKPEPGMLLQAIAEHDIDPNQSIMFGDKVSDIKAAKKAGIKDLVLVRSGHDLSNEDERHADRVLDKIEYVF